MSLNTCILFLCLFSSVSSLIEATFNLTLPHQHPNPEAVVLEVHRRVSESISRREMMGVQEKDQSCLTANPIDDCWRCDPNWQTDRQKLADCGVGFGTDALGGKGGQIYVVTDSSDENMENPTPGTLRHASIQTEPLWIVFSSNMEIKLKSELFINSFKTIDGRGATVEITGDGCIIIQDVSNVIIHNIHVHHCKPSGKTEMCSSPTQCGHRGKSDGDGISISGSRKIWIDHCSLSYCKDGLIDVKLGSTGITISNNYFSHHDKVMLLGSSDRDLVDVGMQVTIAFNHFGEELVQRMPRCRHGYFHLVNNDYTQWEMYAIGGSANPTINCQGNRFTAKDSKEVTKREDADKDEWMKWNWRSEGDIMVNGAFFVPSGEGFSSLYAEDSGTQPRSASLIDQLTMNAGVLGSNGDRESIPNPWPSGGLTDTTTNNNDWSGGGYGGWTIAGSSPGPSSTTSSLLFILIILHTIINHDVIFILT